MSSLGDQLVDIIMDYEMRNEELEYIALTKEGFWTLNGELGMPVPTTYNPHGVLGLFMGVTLVGDKYEDNDSGGSQETSPRYKRLRRL